MTVAFVDPLPRARAVLSLRRVEVLDAHRQFAEARGSRERARATLVAITASRQAVMVAIEEARGRVHLRGDAPVAAGALSRWEDGRVVLLARLERARAAEGAARATFDGTRAAEETARARLERSLSARQSAERAVARAERARPRARERREARQVEDRLACLRPDSRGPRAAD